MAYIAKDYGWERVTEAARARYGYLQSTGYLHSDYDRFKEIHKYSKVYYAKVMDKLAKQIIKTQENREKEVYAALGVSGVKELNEKYFKGDQAIDTFMENSFNNLYYTVADTLKERWGNSDLNQSMSKSKKRTIEKRIESRFQDALDNLTDDYKKNFSKITNNGTFSKDAVNILKEVDNRKADGKMKSAKQYAASALGQWKGHLLEQCLGMCAAQIGKVKNVEITGGNLDSLNKFIKSDITFHTEEMNIGISAKNYIVDEDKAGNLSTRYSMVLHGGSGGTSFESFLERINSLKSDNFQGSLNTITKRLKTDNYYYNLINEAANKITFKSSQPAQDFVNIVKGLAAAWFGTQLLTDTKKGNKGQNVDFFVVGKYGFIPMSKMLNGLMNYTVHLSVNINSTADIDTDNIYLRKIKAQHGPMLYSGDEVFIGRDAGKEVYKGIKVSPIKLRMILNQFM